MFASLPLDDNNKILDQKEGKTISTINKITENIECLKEEYNIT